MKKLAATTLNIILALGVVCILAGILLFPRLASHFNAHVETWTVILTVVGALVFCFSLVKYSSALVFFLGLYTLLTGFLFMIIGSGLVPFGIEGLWPVSIILAGFGIEGTVFADIVLLAACVLLYLWGRKHGKKSMDVWAE